MIDVLSWLFGAEEGAQVVVTAGFDSATVTLLVVLMFLVAFVAVVIGAAWLTSRVSKAKDEMIHRVETESMQIKGFYQGTISRLVEGTSLQTMKDVFQTVSQGTRPLKGE